MKEEKSYSEKVIDEMVEMIKYNITMYYKYSDDYFLGLKDYCKNKKDDNYKEPSSAYLLFLVEEALAELINCPFLYDARDMD